MTNQTVLVSQDLLVSASTPAMATAPNPASYRPPRSATSTANYKKLMSHLELHGAGNRTSSWLESMRASSPTHIRPLPFTAFSETEEYLEWIRRHPSVLTKFEDVTAAAKGKKIIMFLDYDGTLSPIVDDPDSAFMSKAMRAAVKAVAKYFPTAIVSGRCRDKVFNFVQLSELYYAGSHGMDIRGPTKWPKHIKPQEKSVLCQPAWSFLPMINEVYNLLLEKTKLIPGSKIENNRFCLSVHFRCVEENIWNRLAEEVRSVLARYPDLKLTQGRKVLEIRPTIEWDKGKALEFLLNELGFADSNDIFPIYIGDDRTDEDAFKVLRDRGQGFGVLVSKYPKETCATYSLKEPSEVKDFLRRLVEWKRFSMKEQLRIFNSMNII